MSSLTRKCLNLWTWDFLQSSYSIRDDAKLLYSLTKESWNFDRRNATFVILNKILCGIIDYAEIVVNASFLTQSILILQHDPAFQKTSFLKLVLVKICFTALNIGRKKYQLKIKKVLEPLIRRKRILRLLKAYFQLSHPQQVKEGIQTRFDNVNMNCYDTADCFENTIEAICHIVETCVVILVFGYNLRKISPVAGIILVIFTVFQTAHVVYQLNKNSEPAVTGYKSEAERRASTLQYFPCHSKEHAQDLKLYGAENWLLANLRRALENEKPTRYRFYRVETLEKCFDLLQSLGNPVLMVVFGIAIDLESFNLVFASFDRVDRNIRSLSWTVRNLQRRVLPFAKSYYE